MEPVSSAAKRHTFLRAGASHKMAGEANFLRKFSVKDNPTSSSIRSPPGIEAKGNHHFQSSAAAAATTAYSYPTTDFFYFGSEASRSTFASACLYPLWHRIHDVVTTNGTGFSLPSSISAPLPQMDEVNHHLCASRMALNDSQNYS